MILYLCRHAIAEDASPQISDANRALTSEGRQKMQAAALGFKTLKPEVTVLVSSPYKRTQETAKIIADELGIISIETRKELLGFSDPHDFRTVLDEFADSCAICAVGHMPHILLLANMLLDTEDAIQEYKRGSIAKILFKKRATFGEGTLEWHRSTRELAELAGQKW